MNKTAKWDFNDLSNKELSTYIFYSSGPGPARGGKGDNDPGAHGL